MSKRYFEFTEGSSDKFWEIILDGSSFSTRWGRRGTAGQNKEKSFETEAEALKQHDKLVAEKLREGYLEKGGEAALGASAQEVAPAAKAAAAATPTSRPAAPEAQASPARAAAHQRPDGNPAERSIALKIGEWRVATWRDIPPPAEGPEPPFSLEACIARSRKSKWKYWYHDWDGCKICLPMSLDEAHFWYFMMMACETEDSLEAVIAKLLPKEKFNGSFGKADMTRIDALRTVNKKEAHKRASASIVIPMCRALSNRELIDILLAPDKGVKRENLGDAYLAPLFIERHLPRLCGAEAEDARERIASLIKANPWPADRYCETLLYQAAAVLGMHEALLPAIESIPADTYTIEDWGDHYHKPQAVIFGLRDPALVARHVKRLKLKLQTPETVKGWLAHTEYAELDYAAESICAELNREKAEEAIKALALVDAPEATGPMLKLLLRSKAPRIAKEWLTAKPRRSIDQLALLASGSGSTADSATDILCAFLADGWKSNIESALGLLDEAGQRKLREAILENPALSAQPFPDAELPPSLLPYLSPATKVKLPTWLNPGELPPIILQGRRLSTDQVARLLAALQTAVLPSAPEAVTALKALAVASALERFAWKLFELWQDAGTPPKDKWAFLALGVLGGDAVALKLAPLIKAWPGEAQHQRAVAGLEILCSIGTDTALMQLNGIANKVPFKALKQRANECMEEIAASMGLSKAELEDRVVPDCGLDERGRRVFDFGPRKYEFIMGPDMKPMLRDQEGKRRPDLPAPNAKDDPDLSAASVEEWKLLKKQIREVGKIQASRMEQAMVVGRRWPPKDFELLIARHPLMTHVARLLLWGGYDAKGGLVKLFRVTEEQDYADAADAKLALDGCAKVGVVHPLGIPKNDLAAWGALFSDYEIIPPFPQLGRPVYALDAIELKGLEITRIAALKFPAPTLVFSLEKLGWARGLAMDAGCFTEHSKQYPAAGLTAVITYEGNVGMGWIDASEELTKASVYLVKGLREPQGYSDDKNKLALKDADPVVLSEILYDLAILASKLKE